MNLTGWSFLVTVFLGLAVVLKLGTCSEEEIDYYVDLINRETAKALSYESPQDFGEFKPNSQIIRNYGKYDYIVIGAGSAGSVVANRLSESGKYTVLLLEAGKNESDFTDIPAYSYYLSFSDYGWDFKTTPQANACQGMVNNQCGAPRGKGLGGSSLTYTLNYVRGNRRDYDHWEKIGNFDWSYENVLPYFKKSEDARFPVNEDYHGIGGRMHVEWLTPNGPQYNAFVDANLEKGRPMLDHNAAEQLGVGRTQYCTINGRRDSSAKAFLRDGRSNLKILTRAFATKIDINKRTMQASGVIFSHRNTLYKAYIKKEIIVSAGAFQTPQLLMLSGIGLPEDLNPLGIESIQPLAVGHNLIDHTSYAGLIFETNSSVPVESLRELVRQYLNGYGPLTFGVNSKAISFFQTPLASEENYPDIEVLIVTSNSSGPITQRSNNYNDETYNALFSNVDPTRSFSTPLLLMRPDSRGRVTLNSSDPYHFPIIDNNFYADPKNLDFETMYEGIQIILDLVTTTEAFRKINATLMYQPLPACQQYEYLSREYWYCQLRQISYAFHHPVGTCKMGPDPRKGAVVNPRLQIHGIKNVRVADCSIMPTQITGHTHAPATMIGERAASFILQGK